METKEYNSTDKQIAELIQKNINSNSMLKDLIHEIEIIQLYSAQRSEVDTSCALSKLILKYKK